MPAYEGTGDDYRELFLQFGYISLFSCVYPLASVCAFVNNLTEAWTDRWKLVAVHQRPFPTPASADRFWRLAFELMGILAVLTNVSIIAMSADFKATFVDVEGVFDRWQIFALLVVAGLLLKLLIAKAIPDAPAEVGDGRKRANDGSIQALKTSRERALELLSRDKAKSE